MKIEINNSNPLFKTARLLACFSVLFFANSCSKSIESPDYQAYTITDLDASGGTWKTYVLATSSDIAVDAPTATNSPEYLVEIQDLKTAQSAVTSDQKNAISYWSVGGVFRWNEIARELAAKYNLPPAQRDTLYPVPDRNNPLADPKFPFANPPYTARAFAYLAVAQYDALVSAWNYKYKYNRLAPYKIDATIKPSVPTSDLPSYPSEDAVVAEASAAILKNMFPGEVDYINLKLAEHKNTRMWAGANVKSDITAGEGLGKAVAAKVLSRGSTDGMGNANNQTLVAGLKQDAISRGQTVLWKSLEVAPRPPMLPIYGRVKTWNFDEATKISLRPGPPPAIGSAEFNKDFDEMKKYAKSLTSDEFKIAAYWSDGAGSYTPPGHWNRITSELVYKNKLNELRSARAFALVGTAVMDAGVCCWDVKYYYYFPRPFQIDASIKTTIGIPNFPSYTSGHSTFSGAAAAVLSYIFPSETENVNAKAIEASNSRIYGCIHYRFDCEIGLEVGKNVGNYSVNRGKADGSGL